MNKEETKLLIQEVFHQVVENLVFSEETIAKYFHPSYMQYVDDKVINYSEFLHHMKAQKEVMDAIHIRWEELIVEDNKVVSIHYVDGRKKTGEEIGFKVFACFHINETKKLVLCNELTMMTKGSRTDKDLGSRTKNNQEN
jgi:hypothetical protein